ncbi:MAG: PAS domain-containing sensor histidine kinase [Calditrichaeota bacterium]|nr:PAS domain-containing sensor histidine kinase [Calditrichota bacterium]
MISESHTFEFAPGDRASEVEVQIEADELSTKSLLRELLDAMPDVVFILNRYRQIVFANKRCAEVFQAQDRVDIYGLLPGEAINCVNTVEAEHGCGTGSACQNCCAVKAVRAGLKGEKSIGDCRISQISTGRNFDFRVRTTPFQPNGEPCVIFAATDISQEKRRNVLEQAFLHDITNTISSLILHTDLLTLSPEVQNDNLDSLANCANRLLEEINSHKELIDAENGILAVKPVHFSSHAFLQEMQSVYSKSELIETLQIFIAEDSIDMMVFSDKTLLSRIIGNMLKNAIEATTADEVVLMGCRMEKDMEISFWIQNFQSISPDNQLQIFNRSFSTKGIGRGIGTYSMKLIAEKYLKGRVYFNTSRAEGTIFYVTIPAFLHLYEPPQFSILDLEIEP